MPHFIIVLIQYIDLLNLSWMKMSNFEEYWAFKASQMGMEGHSRVPQPHQLNSCKKWAWAHFLQDCMRPRKDQPAQLLSLIRVFAAHLKTLWIFGYPQSALRRFWSDCGMCRRIWVFVGRTCNLVGNAVPRLSYEVYKHKTQTIHRQMLTKWTKRNSRRRTNLGRGVYC